MMKKNKTKKIISKSLLFSAILFGMMGNLFLIDSVSAQTCPINTTVSGTTVMFVGELTDMGGDQTNNVWFEYGKTTSYGQKTVEKSLTAPGLYCISVTGLSPSTTYHYRAAAKNSAGTAYGENKSFTTTSGPTVNLRANGSNGPITVPYNGSVSLSWISSNVDSCVASDAWTGNKGVIDSQSIQNLTSSKTYTLNCTGPGGSASDSVTVNVSGQISSADFSINKTVRNLSQTTSFLKTVNVNPGEVLVYGVVIQAGNDSLNNVIVKDVLPAGLIYEGDLRVDNISTAGNINTGLNIGNLSAGQKKTITFKTRVAGAENFTFGQTEITNTVTVSSDQSSLSDTAKVIVVKTAIAGIATQVPTGLTNNPFLDSFLLPLTLTLLIIWLFKSRIVRFEEWLDSRKKEYQVYKSKKILQIKIARIKAQEFFQKVI